jgi:hypothetical protein
VGYDTFLSLLIILIYSAKQAPLKKNKSAIEDQRESGLYTNTRKPG